MTDDPATDLSLEDQIQSLPQELQDEIFAQWMQFAPGIIVIDENYKPPTQLQIDKKSRAQAIEIYYRHPRVFTADVYPPKSFDCVEACISTLKHNIPHAAANIQELRLEYGVAFRAAVVSDFLSHYHIQLKTGVLKMKVRWWSFEKSDWQAGWMSYQEAAAQDECMAVEDQAGLLRPTWTQGFL